MAIVGGSIAGLGAEAFTLDLDSTICETYGLAKQGAQHHGYTHVRGYHPLLAVGTGTGDVLHTRLRGGNAHSGRGAGSFLAETIERVREAGASGALTVRADSGFYSHAVVATARRHDVRFSITVRLSPALHTVIEAIPEADWKPIPYWMEGAADVAETTYTPFASTGPTCSSRIHRPSASSYLWIAGPRLDRRNTITSVMVASKRLGGCWLAGAAA